MSRGALTPRQLNRATLARQMLLQRRRVGVVDAVRQVVAIQAQEPASPYLALWNRVAGFDPDDLDAAFADYAVVKTPLVRITLHAIAAEEYTTFHEASQPMLRGSRLNDRRFRATGMTIEEADAIVPDLVKRATRPRTKEHFEGLLAERLDADPEPGVWWAMRTFAPLVHAPTGGPWSFGRQPQYRAGPKTPRRRDQARSMQELARRYLEGFGPASAVDLARFTMYHRQGTRDALGAISDELVRYEGPGGVELFDVPDAPIPAEDVEAPPRLMAMWDSTLLAYDDRSRIIPEEYRKVVIRNNGDVLPTVLIDGYVAGVWRPVDAGIEVTTFRRLSSDDWDGLAREAAGLAAFLADREPTVYSRYHRWWADLSGEQVMVLSG